MEKNKEPEEKEGEQIYKHTKCLIEVTRGQICQKKTEKASLKSRVILKVLQITSDLKSPRDLAYAN
jgi:hypothetical protein